jgi:hypothetical protein
VRELPPVRGAATALALVALAAGPAAGQDRPLLTETALTAPARTLVFETGFDAIVSEPSYVTGQRAAAGRAPLLRLVYSPADNLELDLEWVARVGVWNEAGRKELEGYLDCGLVCRRRLGRITRAATVPGRSFWRAPSR